MNLFIMADLRHDRDSFENISTSTVGKLERLNRKEILKRFPKGIPKRASFKYINKQ